MVTQLPSNHVQVRVINFLFALAVWNTLQCANWLLPTNPRAYKNKKQYSLDGKGMFAIAKLMFMLETVPNITIYNYIILFTTQGRCILDFSTRVEADLRYCT